MISLRIKRQTDGYERLCKECRKQSNKKWYNENIDRHKELVARNYQENKEERNRKSTKWRKDNPEKAKKIGRKSNKIWRDERGGKEYNKQYKMNKLKNNPQYRVSHNFSTYMRSSLREGKNGSHWEDIIGYTLQELIKHLENQFKPGMTWDNYGEWHIDHIRPIVSFNYSSYTDEDFQKCWSLENLQPLWAYENESKGGKILNEDIG